MEKNIMVVSAFGIPGVDLRIQVYDNAVHIKFDLVLDGEARVSNEKLKRVIRHVQKLEYKTEYKIGGNCMLTLAALHVLSAPCNNVMIGAVGNDEKGKAVLEKLNDLQIVTRIDTIDSAPTSLCAVLVEGANRSVLANNGAGEIYSLANLSQLEDKLELIGKSRVVLFEGFFILFSSDIAKAIVDHCERRCGVVLFVNLSSTYVAEEKSREMIDCVRRADIVVGNKREFAAFCKNLQLAASAGEESGSELSRLCQQWMLDGDVIASSRSKKLNSYRAVSSPNEPIIDHGVSDDRIGLSIGLYKKIVLLTDKHRPIFCAYGDNSVMKFAVPRIERRLVRDPVGAGDSFVAGFIAAMLQGKSLHDCVLVAVDISQRYIKGASIFSDISHRTTIESVKL